MQHSDKNIRLLNSWIFEPPQEEDPFYETYSVRTDLALEATEVVKAARKEEIPGANVEVIDGEYAKVTRMGILTVQAAKALGKMPGHYSTIEAPQMRTRNRDLQEEVSQLLAKEVERFLKRIGPDDPVLVVGLGNWNATPDAIGPRVVHHLLITRHLHKFAPPELAGGLRPVAAISPGVMGITGIETGEIVLGLVKQIKPAMVVAIDALASRSVERVCTTIQISDTGINPGAGIGNKRLGITPETLGVPVLAIGIPTVVHATTLVNDALRIIEGENAKGETNQAPPAPKTRFGKINLLGGGQNQATEESQEEPETVNRLAALSRMHPHQKSQVIHQLLDPFMGSLIMTPKEIDIFIEDMAEVVAGGLNAAFHPSVKLDEVLKYLK
ncbi:MAG: GPR endopeptidase [Firmicutes bacterium]|nr:GPR endopeptidase [Bacillota bacterium]